MLALRRALYLLMRILAIETSCDESAVAVLDRAARAAGA